MPYRTAKSGSMGLLGVRVLLLLAIVLVGGCEQKPTTRVPTTAGTTVDLAGSDWLVVNYWAEWCGPCRHEIPELNELDGATLAPGGIGDETATAASSAVLISVLGVNYDGLLDEKLAEVSKRMDITFGVLATDPRERWQQPAPTVLPSTYLIAPGGEFVETLIGPQTRAGILSRIETLAKR